MESINFLVKKPGKDNLNQLFQINITSNETYASLMTFLPKMYKQSDHKHASDKLKLRDIQQNKWPVFFGSINIIKEELPQTEGG